jgi:sensor histidine kinase YesM
LLFSLADVYEKEVSENMGDWDSMTQTFFERRKDGENTRAIWSRLPLFWRFQLAGWAAFVPLTFPLKFLLAGTIPGAILLSFIRDGSSFALTLGMWAIYRRVLNKQNRYRVIVPVVTVVCLTAGLLQTGFVLLFHDIFPLEKEVFFITSVEFSLFYERTALLVCWSLLYIGIKQMRDGMERELRLSLVESEKRRAELKLLRAQMNPHFLFNSLTSIEAGLGKQLPNVSGMVQALADYLHYSLTHRNDDFVPMEKNMTLSWGISPWRDLFLMGN